MIMELSEYWTEIDDDDIIDLIIKKTSGVEILKDIADETAWDDKEQYYAPVNRIMVKLADGADGGSFWITWGADADMEKNKMLIRLDKYDYQEIFYHGLADDDIDDTTDQHAYYGVLWSDFV